MDSCPLKSVATGIKLPDHVATARCTRMHSKNSNTWLAAIVAVFLVVVLPWCWYGAQAQAQALNLPGPSNANSNEEREEHEGHGEQEVETRGNRPPPPPRGASARATGTRIVAAHREPSIVVASVAPVPHPAQFSIRRLR